MSRSVVFLTKRTAERLLISDFYNVLKHFKTSSLEFPEKVHLRFKCS